MRWVDVSFVSWSVIAVSCLFQQVNCKLILVSVDELHSLTRMSIISKKHATISLRIVEPKERLLASDDHRTRTLHTFLFHYPEDFITGKLRRRKIYS